MALNGNLTRKKTLSGTILRATGGSGGTSDYNELSNKPSIGGVVLTGNKTLEDLGINSPTVDSELLPDSTNPAQNRAIVDAVSDEQSVTWEVGGISANNGADTTGTNRLRCIGTVSAGERVFVEVPTDIWWSWRLYNADGTFASSASEFVQSSGAITPNDSTMLCRIVLRRADNAATATADADGVVVRVMTAKLDTNQGTANAGKFLVVGSDGVVAPVTRQAEVTIATDGAVTQALAPNIIYYFTGELTALTITLTSPGANEAAHYHFDFLSGSTAPTVTIPAAVTMPDSFSVEADNRYEVDILNGYGVAQSWGVS